MGQTDQFVSDYECRGLYRKRVDVPVQRAVPMASFATKP
jgi:hypothetical protein